MTPQQRAEFENEIAQIREAIDTLIRDRGLTDDEIRRAQKTEEDARRWMKNFPNLGDPRLPIRRSL